METMAEINSTTHNKYGFKAGGIVSTLEKFSILFGLKLGHIFFGTAEEVSKSLKSLQAKDTTLQEIIHQFAFSIL